MLIRCIINDISKLNNAVVRKRLSESIHLDGGGNDLVVGGFYRVLAVNRWSDGGLRVYLHTVEQRHYPHPYPFEMFEVVDSCMPEGWCVVFEEQPLGVGIKCITFPAWANDDSFFEKLVDGDESAVSIYKENRLEVEPKSSQALGNTKGS